LPNVRLYGADASLLIRRFFPGESVSEYHIYFPDPWPKKKHHKRRLLLPPFCAELHRTLRQDGIVYAASDHAEYFSEFIEYFRALFDVEEIVGPWPDAPNGRTNYEIKYLQAGRPIRRLTARKKQT
jgi:tRNA (guanine-N7-)-methyltransferase